MAGGRRRWLGEDELFEELEEHELHPGKRTLTQGLTPRRSADEPEPGKRSTSQSFAAQPSIDGPPATPATPANPRGSAGGADPAPPEPGGFVGIADIIERR